MIKRGGQITAFHPVYIAGYCKISPYQIVHEYISKHIDCFTIEKGFDLLQKAHCIDEGCITLCSMLFHPETNSVNIALDLKIDRLWKIDIKEKTIETYSGFHRHQKESIPEEGLLSKDLEMIGT